MGQDIGCNRNSVLDLDIRLVRLSKSLLSLCYVAKIYQVNIHNHIQTSMRMGKGIYFFLFVLIW